MPRANPIQPAFNAGELSPRMAARVDFAKFQSGCETLENMLPLPQGGVTRRPGTRFVAAVKDAGKRVKLKAFEFSTEQAYMLEMGEGYVRFYRDQGQIVADATDAAISNGGFDAGIADWDDRSTGAASIAHDAANGRLSLVGSTTDTASAEQDVTTTNTGQEHVLRFAVHGAPGDIVSLQIGSTSTGSEILPAQEFGVGFHCLAFTPTASPFYVQFSQTAAQADEARTVQIDDVNLIDNAPVEIGSPYLEGELPLVDGPQSADTLYLFHQNHAPMKLTRSGHASWSLTEILFQDGPYLETNTDTDKTIAGSANGGVVTLTANVDLFAATDVGRLVRRKSATWGYAVITGFTDAKIVTALVKRDFDAVGAGATWALGAWSGTTGYPRCGALYEERLWAAGTRDRPQTLWASQSADFENMQPDDGTSTVEDDDGLVLTAAADQVNAILWLAPGSLLLAGTTGGPWTVRTTTQGEVITPANAQIKQATTQGADSLPPLRVSQVLLYLQRARRKLLELVFDFQTDGYKAPDLTVLAEHVTRGGIVDMAYQQEPDSVVWCVRGDGELAAMTYRREQDVVGWSRHTLGGRADGGPALAEAVAAIPGAGATVERDEVWLVVRRTVGGAAKRYVEATAKPFQTGDALEGAFYVDSGLSLDTWNQDAAKTLTLTSADWRRGAAATLSATGHGPFLAGDVDKVWRVRRDGKSRAVRITSYTSAASVEVELLQDIPNCLRDRPTNEWLDPESRVTSVSGLDHLEGETVKVLTDGAVHPDRVVTGGAVTLDSPAGAVQAGLGYGHRLTSLRLEAGAAAGTAVGKRKRLHGLTLVLLDSLNARIGPAGDRLEEVKFRDVLDALDTAVPVFTGEKRVAFDGGWDSDARWVLEGDAPTPFTLLAAAPELKTNDVA